MVLIGSSFVKRYLVLVFTFFSIRFYRVLYFEVFGGILYLGFFWDVNLWRS